MAHDPSSDTPSIALVGADAAFLDSIAATLAPVRSVSALVIPESIEQAARRPELESAAVVVVDLDGKRRESLIALQGLTSRIALRTPVIVLTDAFDDALARWFLQIRVADFLRKPVEPKEVLRPACRFCAPAPIARRQRTHPSRFPARDGRRRRDDAGDRVRDAAARDAKEPDSDLPGRSRFPEQRLRRLSRHRAAARARRDRAASRAAGHAAPRGDVQPAPNRACVVLAAEGPSRRARATDPAFMLRLSISSPPLRECRDRPAARLGRLDRSGAGRVHASLCRDRHDRPGLRFGGRICHRPRRAPARCGARA